MVLIVAAVRSVLGECAARDLLDERLGLHWTLTASKGAAGDRNDQVVVGRAGSEVGLTQALRDARLNEAGISLSLLRRCGLSLLRLHDAGISVAQMKEGGVLASELVALDFDVAVLGTGGFRLDNKLAEVPKVAQFLSKVGWRGALTEMAEREG